jgi:glycosyltransferase involved in cell wall biosynthesis
VRVAFDEQIFAIQRYGGIGRLFAELAREFTNNSIPDVELLPLHTRIVSHYVLDDPGLKEALAVKQAKNPWTALARYASSNAHPTKPDLVHNTFYLPPNLRSTYPAKRVITVHDMIPELMPNTRRRLDWLTLKRRYVAAADHIICVSEATKQDLIKVYGLTSAPITVVHHGVNEMFRPGAPRLDFLPDRYILFVGHRKQYKDASVLFAAFADVAKTDLDIELVCVGGEGLTRNEISHLEELGIRNRVSQRYLLDEQMPSAYGNAEVFVFPSHFEGFGLPALEAMACGTPAILARATSLPEVGGGAALYFEPGRIVELSGVITDLIRDSQARIELRESGMRRASEFTWPRAARQTADVYREALADQS